MTTLLHLEWSTWYSMVRGLLEALQPHNRNCVSVEEDDIESKMAIGKRDGVKLSTGSQLKLSSGELLNVSNL